MGVEHEKSYSPLDFELQHLGGGMAHERDLVGIESVCTEREQSWHLIVVELEQSRIHQW